MGVTGEQLGLLLAAGRGRVPRTGSIRRGCRSRSHAGAAARGDLELEPRVGQPRAEGHDGGGGGAHEVEDGGDSGGDGEVMVRLQTTAAWCRLELGPARTARPGCTVMISAAQHSTGTSAAARPATNTRFIHFL